MQLFSIGLWQLNPDGTRELDASGEPIASYDTDDIVSMSKAWTGFDRQLPRENIESRSRRPRGGGDYQPSVNQIDPLQIKPAWRDPFPKMNLYDGYIGDGYTLCADLPANTFLLKGARYLYLGSSPLSLQQTDPSWYAAEGGQTLRLDPSSSALYRRLCNGDGTGSCRFESEVVLDESLGCDGVECLAESASLLSSAQPQSESDAGLLTHTQPRADLKHNTMP